MADNPGATSLGSVRRNRVNELALPRYRNRVSHRGWEVRTAEIVVFASSSRVDAELAMGHVQAAWQNIATLADHWTDVHRHPSFAIGKVLVFVDSEPVRRRGGPLEAVRVDSDGTMIYVNVAPGSPPLTEQRELLQRSAAHAFLHIAELDRQLPRWVLDGLAGYVAREKKVSQQDGQEKPAEVARPTDVPTGGINRHFHRRQTPDRLAPRRDDRETAERWVTYLIEAEEGRHAPGFFTAIGDTMRLAELQQRDTKRPERGPRYRRSRLVPNGVTPLKRLLEGHLDR